MFCKICGTNIPDTTRRCTSCGNFFPRNLSEYTYTVVINSFTDYEAKKKTAKYLSSQSKTQDLKSILSRLENLPVTVSKAAPREKALELDRQFSRLGANLKFIPRFADPQEKQKLIEELKQPISRSYLEDKPLEMPASVKNMEAKPAGYSITRQTMVLFVALGTVLVFTLLLFLYTRYYKDFYNNLPDKETEIEENMPALPAGPGITEPDTPENPEDSETETPPPAAPPGSEGESTEGTGAPGIIITPLPPVSISPLNAEGVRLYNEGKYDEALAEFLAALSQYPDDPTLSRNVAVCYGSMGWRSAEEGDYEKARSHFSSALLYDDSEPLIYKGMGYVTELSGDPVIAESYYKKSLTLDPNDAEVVLALGMLMYNQEKLEEAISYLETYREMKPGDEDIAFYISKIERELDVEESYEISEGEHFIFKYEGMSSKTVGNFLRIVLEEVYITTGSKLGHYPAGKITVILYADEDFRTATLTPDWSGGLYDGKIRIPVRGLEGNSQELERVVTHEYVHAVVFEMAGNNCPVWLNEGLAQYFEGVSVNGAHETTRNFINTYSSDPPLMRYESSFMSLESSEAYLAYEISLSATAFIIKKYGMTYIKTMLDDLGGGADMGTALEKNLYLSYDDFIDRWINYISTL